MLRKLLNKNIFFFFATVLTKAERNYWKGREQVDNRQRQSEIYMVATSRWLRFVIVWHYSIKFLHGFIIRGVVGFEQYFMGLS